MSLCGQLKLNQCIVCHEIGMAWYCWVLAKIHMCNFSSRIRMKICVWFKIFKLNERYHQEHKKIAWCQRKENRSYCGTPFCQDYLIKYIKIDSIYFYVSIIMTQLPQSKCHTLMLSAHIFLFLRMIWSPFVGNLLMPDAAWECLENNFNTTHRIIGMLVLKLLPG